MEVLVPRIQALIIRFIQRNWKQLALSLLQFVNVEIFTIVSKAVEEHLYLVPTPLEEVLLEQRSRELEARNPLPKRLPLLFSILPSEHGRVKQEARARLETIRACKGHRPARGRPWPCTASPRRSRSSCWP